MKMRPRFLLAGALAALTLAGCAAATEDKKTQEPAAGSAATVAPQSAPGADREAVTPSAPAVSEDKQQQAQNLAVKAEKIMLDPALAPREKYPQALKMFREALDIDPNNALATDSIKLIEDIYAGMGRPVPE